MGQVACIEEINLDKSWLETLKHGIFGTSSAGWADNVKLAGC
jgi:hypothetical protein